MTAPPEAEQDPFAEVRVIDSQLQHFRNFIEVISVFRCRLCTFCSPLEHVIASHMSEVHFPKRSFLCKQCLFVFEDRAQLVSHLDSSHGSQSVSVCFGESGTFTNSPPVWRVAGRAGDGTSRLLQQSKDSLDDTQTTEARNGRVTSSTGNIASVTEDLRFQQGSHNFDRNASHGDKSTEGENRGSSAATADRQLERVQSCGSTCHPSTTGQFYESMDTDSNSARLSHENSLEQRGMSIESPDIQVTGINRGETTGRPINKHLFIKTEPVSPVRGLLIPATDRSDSLASQRSVCEEESREDGRVGREGEPIETDSAQMRNDHSPTSVSNSAEQSSEKDSSSPVINEKKDREEERAEAVRVHRIGYYRRQSSAAHSESGGRGVLRRQATVELLDGDQDEENFPGCEGGDGHQSGEENSLSKEKEDGLAQLLESSKSSSSASDSSPVSARGSPSTVDNSSKPGCDQAQPNLRELLTRKMGKDDDKRQKQRDPRKIFLQRNMSEETNASDTSQPPPAAVRGKRLRSYSISEGEIQNHDGRPSLKDYHQQSLPASMEHESPPSRPPAMPVSHHQQPPPSYWPGYPGLAYQPHSWDGDPSKLWRTLTPMNHAAPHSEHHGPTRSQSEEMSSLSTRTAGGGMDESNMYQRFYWKSGQSRIKSRRSGLSGSHSTEGEIPYSGYYLPSMEEFTRRGIPPNQMRFPWQTPGNISSAPGLGLLYQQEKSASPSISSSTQHEKIGSDAFRFHLQHPNGLEMSSAERQGALGVEGTQELAQVEDITRQVQRAFGGAGGLYNHMEHSLISMNGMERSSNSSSQEDPGLKDVDALNDAKKRSRKSTFNIYREIPERKRKLNQDEEEKIKSSYNADGSFDYFSLTGWKAYKCQLCKKRRFKTQSELEEHKLRKHPRDSFSSCTTTSASNAPITCTLKASPKEAAAPQNSANG